jgi:hypothetical protein
MRWRELSRVVRDYHLSILDGGRKGRMTRWQVVANKLSEAATASLNWAAGNGIAFDHGKTEAALFQRRRSTPTATIKAEESEVPFNKQVTRWLGVWLDSQPTIKEHDAIRLKKGKNGMNRLRRLIGRTNGIQQLVNQEARVITGCFRTTNLGALAMESGLRPAATQLENRQRRFWLRLLSLPRRDQAREIVGAASGIGQRPERALGYSGVMEKTILLEEPRTLDVRHSRNLSSPSG